MPFCILTAKVVFWCHSQLRGGLSYRVAERLGGAAVGLAIISAALGVTFLMVRVSMPDSPPGKRAWKLYLGAVAYFSILNFVLHLRLGGTNYPDHSLYVLPWTVTGCLAMTLARWAFENGTWTLLPILPFGVFIHACIWTPLLFRGWCSPLKLRPITVQALWLAVWCLPYFLLRHVVYRFAS